MHNQNSAIAEIGIIADRLANCQTGFNRQETAHREGERKLQLYLIVFTVVSTTLAASPTYGQQKFPVKPIRLVTTGAGATPDTLARLIGSKMSEHWGQAVVIENRHSVVAQLTAAKGTPDGHTLLLASAAIAIRASLSSNPPNDILKDFAGVTEIGNSNTVLLIGPGLGVMSVKDLVAYVRTRPGKVFFATGTAGSADHLNAERFRLAVGINAQHVSFKGQTDALVQVAAGRAHFTSAGMMAALPFIQDGKLVALLQRAPMLPNVPLISDVVPEWTRIGSHAILAPVGTPLAIRQQISKEVARVLNLPDIRERLNATGYQTWPNTPEEHEQNLRNDIAAFAKVIKQIGLRPTTKH